MVAVPDARSKPPPEALQHGGEHAALAAQYKAGADDRYTGPQRGGFHGLVLPVPAQQGTEVPAAWLILFEGFALAVAVIPHR